METANKDQFVKWVKAIALDYARLEDKGLFSLKRNGTGEIISPDGNDYNHLIAVVFVNAPVNGEPSEFYLDSNGLHFHKYKFELGTPDYGTQVHLVYRSEHERLAWVESHCFHKGNTYVYKRYIKGSEESFFKPNDWNDIYHG